MGKDVVTPFDNELTIDFDTLDGRVWVNDTASGRLEGTEDSGFASDWLITSVAVVIDVAAICEANMLLKSSLGFFSRMPAEFRAEKKFKT